MKALRGVVILCLAGIQLVQSAMIDLTPAAGMATEGTDSTITVTCTLNPATALTRDARCVLGVMAGVASSAENGWDVADVAGYPCTIVAGATVGTVDIPLNDDVVIDTGETLTIECATPSTGDTAGTAASFTINDGGLADAQLTVVPRFTLYKVSEEAGMLSIWVDTLDSNGNRAPNEDDIMIELTFPTSATGEDTASSLDYDDTIGPITVFGSANGIATSSFTLDLPMLTDALVENLETVNVLLMDMAPVVSVTSDSTTTISVQILDNDKPELVIVNAKPRLPRRSKQDVVLRAFNAVGSWDSFDLTWFPFNLKDFRTRDITTGNNIAVTETTLARPKYRTRTRFNEYRYSTTQTVSTVPYTLNAYAYVSTTSHSRSRAPIEASVGPTLTIWPLTIDGSGNCATIESTAISVPPNIYTNSMRWWFIKEGGTVADIRRLRQYNGRNWARISECDDAGLYIVLRSRRGKMGWIDHIRVIIAACPEGFTGPPTCMTAAPECRNGGVVDPVLALCSCPPGFAGTNCETVTDPGDFGSSCQFSISDIWPGNRRGKCVAFSFPEPLGVTCATGYSGEDCCKPCEKGITFGANCAYTCHCIDSVCDPYSGVCANGCAPFYTGPNCQSGGPP